MSSNPSTPVVTSDRSFAELSLRQPTRDALQRMQITNPTPIQADALPILLEGRDLIGQARTGSGKTLAFGIPAVESTDAALRAVQVLVLTPTRELAVQVGDVLDQLVAGRGIKVALVYGGRAMGPQKDALRRGAQIVVGTPGRVADLYGQGDLKLDKVRFLVLDEADEMLDRGFAPQVNQILSWTPRERQTALFSATMPAWVDEAARKHLRNPAHVAIDPTPAEAAPIEHVAYDVPAGGKLDALKDLLDGRGDGQMIVFGRTKHGVKKLAKQLVASGYPVAALQGNLSQNARDKVMADFRAGTVPVLLATNVAARGIDVSAVDHVINVELPESSELLTHRIGRTGRMGRAGTAITLLGPEDTDKWRQLERGLGKRIPRKAWTGARRPESVEADVAMFAQAQRPAQAASQRHTRTERPTRVERAPAQRSERAPQGGRSPVQRTERGPQILRGSIAPQRSPEREPQAEQPAARESRPVGSTRPIRPASIRPSKQDDPTRRKSEMTDDVLASLISFTPVSLSKEEFDIEDEPEVEATAQPEFVSSALPLPQKPASAPLPPLGDRTLRPTWGPERQVEATSDERPSRRSVRQGAASRPSTGSSATAGSPRPGRSAPSADAAQHTATCSSCGGTATLRFAPDLSRPVYCDACFKARKEQRGSEPGRMSARS